MREVGKLSDRIGELDDASVIYGADDPDQKVGWRRFALAKVLGTALAAAAIGAGGAVIGEGAAIIVTLVLVVLFLVAYVIWRRRRNERLTGSPTTWPDPSGRSRTT